MFAKLYSYIWGETDTEEIDTLQTLPTCIGDIVEEEIIEKIENIPFQNQTDEICQSNVDVIKVDCISNGDGLEVENGWIHVKDYKVEAISDSESWVSSGIDNENKNEELPQQTLVAPDSSTNRVMKVKVTKTKRKKESRKREPVANQNTHVGIPFMQELFIKKDGHLELQNSDRRMTRKAMKMSNSTALVNSSSNKPSRRRFHYTSNGFSGVVNNRKC